MIRWPNKAEADAKQRQGYYLAGLSLIPLQQPAQAASLFQYALQYAPESARGSIIQQLNMAQAAQNSQQASLPPYPQQ